MRDENNIKIRLLIYIMIVNFVIVALLLCLTACLGYIYWLHRKKNSQEKIKKVDKKVDDVDDEDDITFLNSNYDPSITTKDDDELFPDGGDDETTTTTTTDAE